MSKMNIPVILGTARKDRKSIKAAEFILNELNSEKIKTKLIDVRDYRLKATDNTESTEKAKKFAEQVINADALIIVSPEYNHFFPGELKMLLDMLYSQYNSKPVALIG
ncbi:MAG: NAD(P)H-dependent oxidoreductase, partial [Candidatus Diapherotrites archaeon]|nr:NAD(P)H-dependent oxidoreductase [Candidatus Diapherotrites archaeon]